MNDRPDPPVAERRPATRERHGDEVVDDYAWLIDRDDPAVRPYLEAENAYTESITAPLAGLRDRIFGEIRERTQETDLSVPDRKGGWWYVTRTEEGQSYPRHCRWPDGKPDAEEIILDENVLAEGHDYLSVGVAAVSPDGRRLAYSVDHAGDETHTLHVRDLTTGRDLDEAILNTSYGFAWSADGSTCFYTTLDAAKRPHRVHRHVVGTPSDDDVVIFEEPDERFYVGVSLSRSEDLVVIDAASAVTTETWLLDAHRPTGELRIVEPREQGVEYSVSHHIDHLYVVSNHDGAEDFALWRAPVAVPGRAGWVPVLAHRPGTRVEAAECFVGHVVVHLRHEGLTAIRILDLANDTWRELERPEEVSTIGPGANAEFATTSYRFGFQSMRTPASVFDEDLDTGERELRKRQPVLGDFDPGRYQSTREWATAVDGTRVPISLVWRPDRVGPGPAPCLLYGYGSYEASLDPWFSIARLSLLDRGVVFAVAHVRGGGELGRRWYEDGKLGAKPTTFDDFVACARHLCDTGWTEPERLAARGGSAGGLLMGAVANRAPELFRAIVAEVPFVDALNTILDPSLPLTVIEWEEWGNPVDDPDAYLVMKGYSPYENVTAATYPAILATSGWSDPRVGYHEPAKWVARLRATATNGPDRPILLRTELESGHGGPSGRYDAWREEAFVLAFLLDQLGVV